MANFCLTLDDFRRLILSNDFVKFKERTDTVNLFYLVNYARPTDQPERQKDEGKGNWRVALPIIMSAKTARRSESVDILRHGSAASVT